MADTPQSYVKDEAGHIPGRRVITGWWNGRKVFERSVTILEIDETIAAAHRHIARFERKSND